MTPDRPDLLDRPNKPQSAYVTPQDFAERLGLKRDHVYDLLKRREIRGRKFGDRWMVERTQLEELLPQGTPA